MLFLRKTMTGPWLVFLEAFNRQVGHITTSLEISKQYKNKGILIICFYWHMKEHMQMLQEKELLSSKFYAKPNKSIWLNVSQIDDSSQLN